MGSTHVAEDFPIKQGLKRFIDVYNFPYIQSVAEDFPIKQGLKPFLSRMMDLLWETIVAEDFPIKQGLKLIPNR